MNNTFRYQPSGDFLPQAPEEPEEIREARANFYSLWESIAAEHKRLMEEAAAANGNNNNDGAVVQVDSYKNEDPVIDSYEVDLRQGEISRKKRQAVLPLVSAAPHSAYYLVPQRPVYPLYPAQVPLVPVVAAQQQQQVVRRPVVVQQQQQQPFRVFPAVPANNNNKKQEEAKKPVHPPVIPDTPEAEESGVVAL